MKRDGKEKEKTLMKYYCSFVKVVFATILVLISAFGVVFERRLEH